MTAVPGSGLGARRWSTAVGILLLVVPILLWMLADGHPRVGGLYHDDGVYLSLGHSLARRGVYRSDDAPAPIQIAKYPPGVPLLAAGAFSLTDDVEEALTWIRVLNAGFLVLALAAFAVILFREGLGYVAPFLLPALAWSAATLDAVRVAMSEVPYLAISLAAMAAAVRIEASRPRPWRHALELAAWAFAASMFRTLGVAVAAALGVYLVLVRRQGTAWRLALSFVPAFAALQLFLSAHASPAPGYEDVTIYGLPYLRLFDDGLEWLPACVLSNGVQILLSIALQAVPASSHLLPIGFAVTWIAVLAVLALLAAGLREDVRRGRLAQNPAVQLGSIGCNAVAMGDDLGRPSVATFWRPWHLLVLATLVMILPWPDRPPRFIMPLVPFLYLLLVRGAESVAGRVGGVVAAVALAAASIVPSLPSRLVQDEHSYSDGDRQRSVGDMLEVARRLRHARVDPPVVVASTYDTLLALHADVLGVWGWTVTANRHLYGQPQDLARFNMHPETWQWVARELFAADLFWFEQTRPNSPEHRAMLAQAGADPAALHARGEQREPLLRAFEDDRDSVRDQFRRLGVTHVVLLPREGNPMFEAMLARLVRALAESGQATPLPDLAPVATQVWRLKL
ncbi:MAG: hypothetical protein R3F56_03365 [Planctomycetota bacterium]